MAFMSSLAFVPDLLRAAAVWGGLGSLPVEDPGLARVATEDGPEWVIREEPLLLEVEGERVLTMRTPGEDEALALGFLLGEGVIQGLDEVREIVSVPARGEGPEAAVDVVRVSLVTPEKARGASGVLARAHEIRASCGLCGRTSGEGLTKGLVPLVPGKPRVERAVLVAMVRDLAARQERFKKTGGCHAAGLFSAAGEVWAVAEDVGRHNALDKAIGLAVRAGRDPREGVVILSGRGGFELLLKALRVGAAVVASVGAASSLAVEIADEAGATLVGFVREGKEGRVYSDDGRLSGR
jgi:FdhD protein